MTWNQWTKELQSRTEAFLTWRKRRKEQKREKQKQKNPVQDWVEAILSAVLIVLLINQFLLQAYQIPSQSMVSTLKIGDRIFVNKLVYGPELLPGLMKLDGFRKPRRGEVIIFENPSYIPIGPVKDILQRVVYMLTLSLVDIDRDEFGQPKHHFLIKRAIGMPGDRIRLREGEVEILAAGESSWMRETELKESLGLSYQTRRLFASQEYESMRAAGIGLALIDARLPLTTGQEKRVELYFTVNRKSDGDVSWSQNKLVDNAYLELWRYRTLYSVRPSSANLQSQWCALERGWYIPRQRVFPMGDNRDDSRDARYFGPVRFDKVLGNALFRYWPLNRFGLIR